MLKQWDHVLDDYSRWHALDKFGEVVRGLSAYHGCLIVDEL
jgi:hypothetical protein